MRKVIDWFIVLVCAALPLYVVRFKILGVPTTFLEILILVLFLLWFFEKGLRTKKWLKLLNFGEYTIPVILFITTAAVSTVLSFDQNGGLGIFRAFFLEPILLFLIILERVQNGSGKYVLFGLVLASVWLSMLAILQKLGIAPVSEYAKNEIVQGRVVGVYNSANSLALFVGPVFALVLGTVFSKVKSTKNFHHLFFLSFVLFLQATVIIFTQSQAGVFAIGVVSIFAILAKILPNKFLVKIYQLIITLAIILTFLLPSLSFLGVNLGSIFSDTTLVNRNFVWQGTISLIFDRPLTGSGLDGFKELYGANYSSPAYSELLQYPHNLVLTFWSELGLLGMLVFFWFVVKLAQKAASNKMIGSGLMLAVIYFLIHGIVDVPYFKNDLSAQFFILLALTGWKGNE